MRGAYGGYGNMNSKVPQAVVRHHQHAVSSTSSRGPALESLIVTGCQHETVGDIVRGTFSLTVENHGKPVYKKDSQANGLDVMLYFWDDRDGPNFCGWWFGPKVGGDQVWAFHPDKVSAPPATGWKVPYDGPVDSTFTISVQDDRRQMDRRRQQQAELEKKRVEQNKRQQEELKKKQQEENKRRVDEASQKRAEDLKRKRELEEKRRAEQKAALAIRRVIQKVRLAQPESFEELSKELEESLNAELENTGSQQQKMREESEKGLEQARRRILQINEQRRKEGERKTLEAKRRREQEELSKALLKELTDLVNAAEESSRNLQEKARPLEGDTELSVEDVEGTMNAVEVAGAEAKTLTKSCTDFITSKSAEMKDPSILPAGASPSEAKQTLVELLHRINECSRSTELTMACARGVKDKAVRRAAARQKTQEMSVIFEKYDKDADDMLSTKEVAAYARGEFDFLLPQSTLEAIWRTCVDDHAKGVKLDKFQAVKVAVGVARELKRDGQRRADREEKERVLKVMKADMVDKVKDAGKAVDAADLDVVKLEKQVQPLTNKAKTMCAPSMILLADETDTLIGEAKATVMAARRHIESLSEGIEAPFKADLQSFLTTEAKQLELRIGRMDSRLSRATNLSVRFRESANKKVAAELDRLRSNALKVIRYNQRVQKLTNEEVFGQFDANGDDAVSEEEFMEYFDRADKTIKELDTPSMNKDDLLSFLQGEEATATDDPAVVKDGELAGGLEDGQDVKDSQALPSGEAEAPVTSIKPTSDQEEVVDGQQQELKASEDGRGTGDVVEVVELSREEVKRLFAHLCGEQATTLSREAFLRIVRVYMKVVKETAMTGGVSIKGSKTLRRLEPSEVVEIIEGPVKEDTVDVMRVRARAMKDGLDGWITIAGNQGTVFLEDGGNVKAW